jgi:ribosome-interacting GTPase 1
MGVMEKIKEIEAEMARTQKNKATNYHLGTLKAKLARLRNELFVEQSGGSSGGGAGEGFDVARNGDARVALIGFPSAGKSTLLGALTMTVRTYVHCTLYFTLYFTIIFYDAMMRLL